MTNETAALLAETIDLEKACQIAAGRLISPDLDSTIATCQRLAERLKLGIDHTIVALVGGTGSGKSSLFNALAQMQFAAVGPLRPTTERPTACVWGDKADALLTWLGIGEADRIRRDSVLEQHVPALRGLILLDLPDYDSEVGAHRTITERILQQADLLVWVTDPQKYADGTLHHRYIGEIGGRSSSMTVVLNQVDRLEATDQVALEEHLVALLHADGLASPVVMRTSATTGAGVADLRQRLVAATTQRTTAAVRVAEELVHSAVALVELLDNPATAQLCAGEQPTWLFEATERVKNRWLTDCGAKPLRQALLAGQGLDPITSPSSEQIETALLDWLEVILLHLPPVWGQAVGQTLAAPGNIATRLSQALSQVVLPDWPSSWWQRVIRRRRAARQRAEAWQANLAAALESVIERTMTQPTIAVYEDWLACYQIAARIAGLD
ncbi:MAG: 50S ribosome-binding GTPase [Bifidobacteriaceae bacterium]|jgi:GTP-binding protein EngB required for normal cell division|nr:50S ribosome-binding GTPase [Bifidobacteriaceae bacterium]